MSCFRTGPSENNVMQILSMILKQNVYCDQHISCVRSSVNKNKNNKNNIGIITPKTKYKAG